MALSAGTYQGRIGSRTYSMRRNWPVDNVSMISDYKGVMYARGVAGVGHCGCPGEGMSGLGALDTGQRIGIGITVAGVVTVLGLALFAMRG